MVPSLRSDRLFAANRAFLREARVLTPNLSVGEEIEGLIHPREGLLLYILARRAAQLGNVVEIGAYKGRSTWYLARGLRDAGSPYRVISIDPHVDPDQRDAYFATLARHLDGYPVEPRVGFSHALAGSFGDEPVGMLWIDGGHSYRAVRRDFQDWFPRLQVGGWYAMHDTVNSWKGPTKLARELLTRRADLDDVGVVWLTLFARKVRRGLGGRTETLKARLAFEALTLAQARRIGFGPQAAAADEVKRPAARRKARRAARGTRGS